VRDEIISCDAVNNVCRKVARTVTIIINMIKLLRGVCLFYPGEKKIKLQMLGLRFIGVWVQLHTYTLTHTHTHRPLLLRGVCILSR